MVLSLRDPGIAAATGSACSSKTLEPSHTLLVVRAASRRGPRLARVHVRTLEPPGDVDRIMAALPGVVARLRALSPLYKTTTPADRAD